MSRFALPHQLVGLLVLVSFKWQIQTPNGAKLRACLHRLKVTCRRVSSTYLPHRRHLLPSSLIIAHSLSTLFRLLLAADTDTPPRLGYGSPAISRATPGTPVNVLCSAGCSLLHCRRGAVVADVGHSFSTCYHHQLSSIIIIVGRRRLVHRRIEWCGPAH